MNYVCAMNESECLRVQFPKENARGDRRIFREPRLCGTSGYKFHHRIGVFFNSSEVMCGYYQRMVEPCDLGSFELCTRDAPYVPNFDCHFSIEIHVSRSKDHGICPAA